MSEEKIMSDNTVETATAVVEAPQPEVTSVGKTKKAKETGNLILDIAHEVEGLTKTKALNEAARLAENIEVNYFRLGGVLKVINDNSWFEGHKSFEDYVRETHGFESRKARYLITIYDNLVTKQVPWEKVSGLGWTKLKDLAPVLTADNVDEWVAKASPLTVLELQALLKATASGAPTGTSTVNTSGDVVKVVFKLKNDQAEVVNNAVAKAKGELHTEFDSVALENICAGYLGGTSSVPKPTDLKEFLKSVDLETLMGAVASIYDGVYDFSVEPAKAKV
jgi:hypothetical protein